MISSDKMLKHLIGIADKLIEREWSELSIQIEYDIDEFETIIENVENYIEEHLNIFVNNGINCTKKASAFELIIRHRLPLKTSESIEYTEEINSVFAFQVATVLLFGQRNFVLETEKSVVVDDPFDEVMENHLIWLRGLDIRSLKLPVFSNSLFWDLVRIIYNNRENFRGLGN